MPDTISPLVYLISILLAGLLGGGAPALYGTWRSRRKIDAEGSKASAEGGKADAEASVALTTAAMNMVARWEGRVKHLECTVDALTERVRVLEEENDALLRGASRLEGQVVSLGQEPVWRVARLRQQQRGEAGE